MTPAIRGRDGDRPAGALPGGTLCVLGSSSQSKRGLFEAAKRRRARIILVKRNPTWERAYSDAVLERDCADYHELDRTVAEVTAFARSFKAGGVVATADAALPVLAEVARAGDMPGPAPDLVAILRDKALMRRRFEELGLPSARSISARTLAEVERAAAEIGLPVIVKPAIGTGSVGVLLAEDKSGLRRAHEVMSEVGSRPERPPTLVVEEFIEGPEVCVDAVVQNDEILFDNVIDKPRPMTGPLFEELEFVTPTGLGRAAAAQALELNMRLLNGLGLGTGIGHTEIRISERGPRLIETHARTAGQRLPDIVRRTTGVDLFEAAVDLAMGVRPHVDARSCGYAGYQCVYSSRDGILRALYGLDNARQVPGISGIEVITPVGGQIRTLPKHPQQNVAYICAEGPSYEYVRRQLRSAQALIQVEVG